MRFMEFNEFKDKEECALDTEQLNNKLDNFSKQFTNIANQMENIGSPTQEQIDTAINNAIEQGLISGMSSAFVNSLCDILSETLQGTDQTANIESLRSTYGSGSSGGGSGEESGGGDTPVTTYTVTYDLTGYASSNTQTTVTSDNPSYNTTLTLENGYENGSITVTMDGVDITSSVLTDDYILIPTVTGDIVITAQAIVLNDIEILANANQTDYLYLYDGESDGVKGNANKTANYVYVWYSKEVFAEDAEITVTISNNTESDIRLDRCYYGGLLELQKYERITQYISNYKSFSGTVYAGNSLTLKCTVKAGTHFIFTNKDKNLTITAKGNATYKNVLESWLAQSVVATDAMTVNWYVGSDNSTESLYGGYTQGIRTNEALSAGTYEVAILLEASKTISVSYIGVYSGTKSERYNSSSCSIYSLPYLFDKVATIQVPENGYISFRGSGITDNMLYIRKVG